MSPAESKALKRLKRVAWEGSESDLGTVIASDWSGVEIEWDKGKTTFMHHDNMAGITLAARD